MEQNWYPVKAIVSISHEAREGFVATRLRCCYQRDGLDWMTRLIPNEQEPLWEMPESVANALVSALAKANAQTDILDLPRVEVTIDDSRGKFSGYWPGRV